MGSCLSNRQSPPRVNRPFSCISDHCQSALATLSVHNMTDMADICSSVIGESLTRISRQGPRCCFSSGTACSYVVPAGVCLLARNTPLDPPEASLILKKWTVGQRPPSSLSSDAGERNYSTKQGHFFPMVCNKMREISVHKKANSVFKLGFLSNSKQKNTNH